MSDTDQESGHIWFDILFIQLSVDRASKTSIHVFKTTIIWQAEVTPKKITNKKEEWLYSSLALPFSQTENNLSLMQLERYG